MEERNSSNLLDDREELYFNLNHFQALNVKRPTPSFLLYSSVDVFLWVDFLSMYEAKCSPLSDVVKVTNFKIVCSILSLHFCEVQLSFVYQSQSSNLFVLCTHFNSSVRKSWWAGVAKGNELNIGNCLWRRHVISKILSFLSRDG